MPLTLKIAGTLLIALGCIGVGCLLILIMAVVPYIVADLYGDATLILVGLIALTAASAGLAYLGYRLRKRGIRLAEEEWRSQLNS